MNCLRPCIVTKPTADTMSGSLDPTGSTIEVNAHFHAWGVAFEELRDGVGNYTTAVVEYSDGRIDEVPPKWIRFTLPF